MLGVVGTAAGIGAVADASAFARGIFLLRGLGSLLFRALFLEALLLSLFGSVLALLLAGCGEKTQKSAEDLQARYAQMQGYEAIVETAVPREDETLHYTLSLEHSNGETRAAVLAPEELTGVGAVLEGDKLTLTFDDLVLDVGTLSPRVSALSCVPLVLQNFPKVYLDSSGAETLGDVDTLRADFSLTLSGETLACSLWLDASGAPVYAEIAENDKIIAAAEFTNFIFGDILSPDAAQ